MSKAPLDGRVGELSPPVLLHADLTARWRGVSLGVVVLVYLLATWGLANASLNVQSLILVAAVFGILAISLDLVSGMLGLYSLGQGGFFGIGAYLTAIAVANYNMSPFVLLPVVIVVSAVIGILIGAMSLRVSGLYFAITTFIFTLVLTVMETDLQITGGTQGLLGPAFPTFPNRITWLGTPVAWCILLALLLATGLVWNLRRSPLYPVLLAIRDAEPFAEAAGVRTSAIKIGIFGLSAAMAGGAGWLFSFLGVVSPGQFDWSVSLNVLVMILVGGLNTTLGPLIGAAFVSMFPAVVDINAWLQEILYGALSIVAVTVFPEGVVGLLKTRLTAWRVIGAGRGDAAPQNVRAMPAATREDSTAGEAVAVASISVTRLGRRFCAMSTSRSGAAISMASSGQMGPVRAPWRTSLPVVCAPSPVRSWFRASGWTASRRAGGRGSVYGARFRRRSSSANCRQARMSRWVSTRISRASSGARRSGR
jgi:branched-chain amino acid transport system permease protein